MLTVLFHECWFVCAHTINMNRQAFVRNPLQTYFKAQYPKYQTK